MSEFDIIVFGVTGFTGRLVAEYLDQNYPNLNWAAAGRSETKFAQARAEMGLSAAIPFVEADASDAVSIKKMVQRAKLVLTTAGPYQLYGKPLVAACAESGTDYVDLCGEPPFMWNMIETYDEQAKASGARIVHSCGFDSVPSDIGVLFLQDLANRRVGQPIKDVRCRVRSMKGTLSGGTLASGVETQSAARKDPATLQRLMSPFALTPDLSDLNSRLDINLMKTPTLVFGSHRFSWRRSTPKTCIVQIR